MEFNSGKPIQFNHLTGADIQELGELIDAGSPEGLFFGSYLYEGGFNLVETDLGQAASYAESGMEKGNPLCTARYAFFLYFGFGEIKPDPMRAHPYAAKAVPLLETMATPSPSDLGHAYAQSLLGVLYLEGVGVQRDFTKALAWMTLAAEQGEIFAQGNLAYTYMHGRGVKADAAQAAFWYDRSARGGNAVAQERMGEIESKAGNQRRAAAWWRLAGNQGRPVAKMRLGDWYNKRGSLSEAYKHYVTAFFNPALEEVERLQVRGKINFVARAAETISENGVALLKFKNGSKATKIELPPTRPPAPAPGKGKSPKKGRHPR